jgi:hypothetical protein
VPEYIEVNRAFARLATPAAVTSPFDLPSQPVELLCHELPQLLLDLACDAPELLLHSRKA